MAIGSSGSEPGVSLPPPQSFPQVWQRSAPPMVSLERNRIAVSQPENPSAGVEQQPSDLGILQRLWWCAGLHLHKKPWHWGAARDRRPQARQWSQPDCCAALFRWVNASSFPSFWEWSLQKLEHLLQFFLIENIRLLALTFPFSFNTWCESLGGFETRYRYFENRYWHSSFERKLQIYALCKIKL